MAVETLAPVLQFDLARPSDDAGLRALLRDTPMGGRIEVAFLREPNYFHASAVQGTFTQVLVAREEGRVVGAATRAVRPSYINGRRADAGYLGDLRLHPAWRAGTALARGYRMLRELHADGRATVYSTVIVQDNRPALETIAANRAGLPRYTDLGRILTPMIALGRQLPAIDADIVRGTHELLPAIVAKLNENRLQFAPAWTEDDFLDGRLRGFRIENFYVLRRGGGLAGVLGVWDQRAFRQTVVCRYRGLLGAARPLVNRVRRPPLPQPGAAIPCLYAATVSTDDEAAFRALLRRVVNDHAGGSCGSGLRLATDGRSGSEDPSHAGAYTHLVAALHERDPRAAAFAEYRRTPFAGRLFAVTFDGPPTLDDRIPYVEAALL